MKKILFFTLFIFTIQSLSANSISVQGVLRDNNNRAVPEKELGYNMIFKIYTDSLGGSLVSGPHTKNGVNVLNGVYSLDLNVGTELQTGTGELWLDVVVEGSQMGSRVRLHLSPYEHLAYSGDSNAFPGSGDVGIGTLTPTEKLEVNGNVKAHYYYGSAEFMDNIWADDIQDDAITSAKILDETITYLDIGENAIGHSELNSNAVYTYHIADEQIGSADIGPNAVGQSELGSNAVTTAHIDDNAVTTSDIKNGEVSKADLAPGAEAFSNWTLESETFDDLTYEWSGDWWWHYNKGLSCTDDGGFLVIKSSNPDYVNLGACFGVSIYDTWGAGNGYHYITGGSTCENQDLNFSLPCVKGKSMKISFSKWGSDAVGDEQARVVLYTY